jgi:hypothetical protein
MVILKRATSLLSAYIMCLSSVTYAQKPSHLKSFNVKEIVLPSEVTELKKLSGSVYYNNSSKGKVLIPVNYWGKVAQAGLHFVPAETTFITGLSMAGGPSTNSKLNNVRLIRKKGEKLEVKHFDLTDGGTPEVYKYKLKPHDTIYVDESHYYQDRSYYTGLISIFTTVLSAYVLYSQAQK